VTEVLVHESTGMKMTRSRLEDHDNKGGDAIGVHFVAHRDGEVWQCNDVVDQLWHAASHNKFSVSIETVNAVVPRNAPAVAPRIETTDWGHADRDKDTGEARNPKLTYILPTPLQAEAVSILIDWLTDPDVGHGLGIPRTWVGIRENQLLMDRGDHRKMKAPEAGIWAHGYAIDTTHVDGYFLILYAWLRLAARGGTGYSPEDAYQLAIELATHHVSASKRREYIDLTPYLLPVVREDRGPLP
jgi:hypothetical protein